MLFKFHDKKFDNMGRYYDVVRNAMKVLGHSEVAEDNPADIHFYNQILHILNYKLPYKKI